jgi:carboxyl-terminal processing protease
MSNLERDSAVGMLQVLANDVRKNYYDPKFHGLNWDARVAQAKQEIQASKSFNMAMSDIAAALDSLNDTHTFFIPPEHAYHVDYGVRYQIIGEHCYITHVRPKSDAEAKSVKPGDEVLAINGITVNRNNLGKIEYLFNLLRPQAGLRFTLLTPSGSQHDTDVMANVRPTREVVDLTGANGTDVSDLIRGARNEMHLFRARYAEFGDRLLVIRVPIFFFREDQVEDMIGRARKHAGLILDLRGNPGGSVDTLKYLVGGFFDKDIKVADRVGRKETRPEIAKASRRPFDGKLIVLVDSESASAAELFSRIMQIEKRATVIGDKTSGAVMEAEHYREKMGADTVILYGASITEWDLIMSDGKSLEGRGVSPDETMLPSGLDVANGRDPVLAHAAAVLGVNVSPEDAGKSFPFEWSNDY